MNIDMIIKALRCTSTVHTEEVDCGACPYRTVEKLNDSIAKKVGVTEWECCDVDRIALDAADALEKLSGK